MVCVCGLHFFVQPGVAHPLRHAKGGAFEFVFMPKNLKRYYGLQHLHFITCTCYRRLPLLGTATARNLFVKILGEVRDRYGFSLVGYVVMPNHIHLLISEPERGTPSTVMQILKQRASRRLRETEDGGPVRSLGFHSRRAAARPDSSGSADFMTSMCGV